MLDAKRIAALGLASFSLVALAGCKSSAQQAGAKGDTVPSFLKYADYGVDPKLSPEACRHVLVVVNRNDSDGRKVGQYYCQRRKIPKGNAIMVDVANLESISETDYRLRIEDPVRAAIKRSKTRIDYVLLTKGVPIRIGDGNGYSVDGHLATMYLNITPLPPTIDGKEQSGLDVAFKQTLNPYFNAQERFSRDKFNMLLVTRLDGYVYQDLKALVDHSMAAKPHRGPFFFDKATNRNGKGYGDLNRGLDTVHNILKSKGMQSTVDQSADFIAPGKPLAGYASWGSNDGKFDARAYHRLRFLPGAIGETFVSTSGRTFLPTTGGQSLVADLIAQGITGIKGYVSEPYVFALARPEVLMDHYTSGFNLAESFYAASQVVKWKDVVIGDPLCNPYGKDQ